MCVACVWSARALQLAFLAMLLICSLSFKQMHRKGVRGVVNLCEEFEGYPNLYRCFSTVPGPPCAKSDQTIWLQHGRNLEIEQCHLTTCDYCNVPARFIEKGALPLPSSPALLSLENKFTPSSRAQFSDIFFRF